MPSKKLSKPIREQVTPDSDKLDKQKALHALQHVLLTNKNNEEEEEEEDEPLPSWAQLNTSSGNSKGANVEQVLRGDNSATSSSSASQQNENVENAENEGTNTDTANANNKAKSKGSDAGPKMSVKTYMDKTKTAGNDSNENKDESQSQAQAQAQAPSELKVLQQQQKAEISSGVTLKKTKTKTNEKSNNSNVDQVDKVDGASVSTSSRIVSIIALGLVVGLYLGYLANPEQTKQVFDALFSRVPVGVAVKTAAGVMNKAVQVCLDFRGGSCF